METRRMSDGGSEEEYISRGEEMCERKRKMNM